jgi:hypothetical protein
VNYSCKLDYGKAARQIKTEARRNMGRAFREDLCPTIRVDKVKRVLIFQGAKRRQDFPGR